MHHIYFLKQEFKTQDLSNMYRPRLKSQFDILTILDDISKVTQFPCLWKIIVLYKSPGILSEMMLIKCPAHGEQSLNISY